MSKETDRVNYYGKKYSKRELDEYWKANAIKCPKCGYFSMLKRCPICNTELRREEK